MAKAIITSINTVGEKYEVKYESGAIKYYFIDNAPKTVLMWLKDHKEDKIIVKNTVEKKYIKSKKTESIALDIVDYIVNFILISSRLILSIISYLCIALAATCQLIDLSIPYMIICKQKVTQFLTFNFIRLNKNWETFKTNFRRKTIHEDYMKDLLYQIAGIQKI